eukprot:3625667-Amphidinium_carterae.1
MSRLKTLRAETGFQASRVKSLRSNLSAKSSRSVPPDLVVSFVPSEVLFPPGGWGIYARFSRSARHLRCMIGPRPRPFSGATVRRKRFNQSHQKERPMRSAKL